MEEIAAVRVQGYAMVDQEVELGLRSLAVPIYNMHGLVVAALNTGMAAIQVEPEEIIRNYLPMLVKVRDGLRRVLR